MSDNVQLPVPSGTKIAADEVNDPTLGSVKVQYLKIMDGTPDGTSKAKVTNTGGLGVSLVDALDKQIDSILIYQRGCNSATLTASAQVLSGAGKLVDVFVSSVSGSPTLKLWDNTAGSGTALIETFTLVAGQTYSFNHRRCTTGIYATITGTAISVGYDPTTT